MEELGEGRRGELDERGRVGVTFDDTDALVGWLPGVGGAVVDTERERRYAAYVGDDEVAVPSDERR